MFNRRTFVVATGVGVVAGAFGVAQIANAQQTGAASAAPRANGAASPAPGAAATGSNAEGMPGMAGMAGPTTTSQFRYGNHAVSLTESHDAAALVIDGRGPIHLARPEAGKYYTHLLPFTMYDDSTSLVRDVVDSVRHGLFVV